MIVLVMILRNEAETIVETLESAKSAVHRWCILDTGSTDGTQELVLETLDPLKGVLFEEPFVDFSSTRNRVCELAEQLYPGSFQLMLSGTEVLVEGKQLPYLYDDRQLDAFSAHPLMVHFGPSTLYPSLRLFKPSKGWRYKGRTHEVLLGPEAQATVPVPSVHIEHRGKPGGENKTERWMRDLELLALDQQDNPTDPRPVFYGAQTLACLGETQSAYLQYARRRTMGGYHEELFISELAMGRLVRTLDDQGGAILSVGHFQSAHELCPWRAEPLYELALHHHKKEQWAMAYLYAKAALCCRPRTSDLFLERDVYDYKAADMVATHAFRYGETKRGMRAAKEALAGNPYDARLQANLNWYVENFGASHG